MPPSAPARLEVAELEALVDAGEVDTVVACLTDVQGRLQGKRLHARYFLDEVLGHGTEACNYLLAVDVDMNTVGGYAISSWERGYGDFELRPDLATMRRASWLPATVIVQCDVLWLDGAPVVQSPRQILTRQVEEAASMGFSAVAGTELEFLVFEDPFDQAWDKRYTGLTPSNRYNVDYSIMGTGRVEPLLRDIRNAMYAAGLRVESAKGECNFGQHEIAFRYADVLKTADDHALYKMAAKEIAAAHGKSLTFMSKFDEREGNSCHIHMSLRSPDGGVVFDSDPGRTDVFGGFVAGVLATLREFTLLYAPNVNSYKRFAVGSFAPTRSRGARTTGPARARRRARTLAAARAPAARRRRQPVRRAGRHARRRAVRHPLRARPARRLRGQRVRLRAADGPDHAARGARPLRRQLDRARGLRRRGRRPLRQRGRRRTGRLRGRRHRLGARAGVRTTVTTEQNWP